MVRKWIPFVLVVIAVVASIVAYPQLSERMPTHWNASGEVNGWSSRFSGAWMLPLVMAFVWLLMRALPHIDPRKANYAKFAGMYDTLIILVLTFMLMLHILLLMAGTGRPVAMERIMAPAVGVFIAVIGLLLPRAHPNWFVGIRTPWTLSSDLSWERTHKIGGTLFVVLGLVIVASTFIRPERGIWLIAPVAFGVALFLFVYSYRVWKEDPLRR